MGEYSVEEAYQILMSATPYSQSTGGAMLRNFGAGAQLMAAHLRATGAAASSAGDAGAAAQAQAERHAAWFDQVAANSSEAAGKLDQLAAAGNGHQATAQAVYSSYKQAVAADSGPVASAGADVNLIHQSVNGSNVLSQAVNDWGQSYAGFKMPKPPPVPSTGGSAGTGGGAAPSGGGSSGGGYSGGGYSGGSGGGSAGGAYVGGGYSGGGSSGGGYSGGGYSGGDNPVLVPPAGVSVGGGPVIDRGAGVPGSVEVGPSGGEFAGWFHDPRTGYYVDPATGREFDPVTNRWVDPVTGLPFGEVTQYATGLQGLGGASTTGGLLSDTGATATAGVSGAGVPGLSGAGGFAGLFAGGGSPTAVAGFYGGAVPPSLASGSAASSSLWQQAGRSLAVKQEVAASLLAREQAARAGRPYLPPTQAGMAGGAAARGGRTRPGYLTAEEEEAGLFSSSRSGRTASLAAEQEESGVFGSRSGRAGAVAAEEEESELAASPGGRRAYLPPSQAGGGKGEKDRARRRPGWATDDNLFDPDPAPSGVLGEE